jgi:TetR/AcrR family transcriptional repressor of nem operon
MATTSAATKGERTRERVIASAAPVFNQRGYWGATLRDLMSATGLEKGGIYNHFRSKDELAAAAFEHNVDRMGELIRSALSSSPRDAGSRLRAVLGVYQRFVRAPIPGGCPILNAATDTDDTHPAMRAQVQEAMRRLREDTLLRIVARGIERGEVRADVSASDVATVFVSTIEGALMLAQLYGDPSYIDVATAHLDGYVDTLLEVPA